MNADTPRAPSSHDRPSVALVATARPRFAFDAARDLLTRARAVLTELGADVFGPEDLCRRGWKRRGSRCCASVAPDVNTARLVRTERQTRKLLRWQRRPGRGG